MLVAGIFCNIIGSALMFFWAFCFTLKSVGDVGFTISHVGKLSLGLFNWWSIHYSDKLRAVVMIVGVFGFLILLVGFVFQLIHVLCN